MINPIAAIKAFFTINSGVKEIAKEATTMNGPTPGWKTTEFWSHVILQIGTLWSAIHGFIPAKYEAIIAVVGTAVYTVCRTVYKAYTDVKAATAPATQVDAQTVVVNK